MLIKSYELMTFFPGYLQGVSSLRLGELQFAGLRVPGRVVLFRCRTSANCSAALRQAGDELPTTMEFINRKTPWLGNLLLTPR